MEVPTHGAPRRFLFIVHRHAPRIADRFAYLTVVCLPPVRLRTRAKIPPCFGQPFRNILGRMTGCEREAGGRCLPGAEE
jgi:hypothetical protein